MRSPQSIIKGIAQHITHVSLQVVKENEVMYDRVVCRIRFNNLEVATQFIDEPFGVREFLPSSATICDKVGNAANREMKKRENEKLRESGEYSDQLQTFSLKIEVTAEARVALLEYFGSKNSPRSPLLDIKILLTSKCVKISAIGC